MVDGYSDQLANQLPTVNFDHQESEVLLRLGTLEVYLCEPLRSCRFQVATFDRYEKVVTIVPQALLSRLYSPARNCPHGQYFNIVITGLSKVTILR
jgi:hypothetical protein